MSAFTWQIVLFFLKFLRFYYYYTMLSPSMVKAYSERGQTLASVQRDRMETRFKNAFSHYVVLLCYDKCIKNYYYICYIMFSQRSVLFIINIFCDFRFAYSICELFFSVYIILYDFCMYNSLNNTANYFN